MLSKFIHGFPNGLIKFNQVGNGSSMLHGSLIGVLVACDVSTRCVHKNFLPKSSCALDIYDLLESLWNVIIHYCLRQSFLYY